MLIRVLNNPKNKKYELWFKSHYSDQPCGWRLRKDGKFPLDKFIFRTKVEAEEACKLLQKYVDSEDFKNEYRERKKEKYVEERVSIFG